MKTNSSSVSVSRFGYLYQSKRCRESSTLKLKTSLLPSLGGCSTGGLRFGLILDYFQIFTSPKMQPTKINNKTECLSLLGLNHSAGQGCPYTIVSGQTHWC